MSFCKELWDFQTRVHELAKDKGWYDVTRTPLEAHMLIVTEVAEASECIRRDEKPWWLAPDGKPEGELAELADVVIRVMDRSGSQGWDLGEAILRKHAYNKTREYRHGGKKA